MHLLDKLHKESAGKSNYGLDHPLTQCFPLLRFLRPYLNQIHERVGRFLQAFS